MIFALALGLLLAIGAGAGVMAGLLGVGGGVILVPAFFYLFTALGFGGASVMQICLATSLATIIVTSIRSVMAHNKKGTVDWQILRDWGPFIAMGALVGVFTVAGLSSTVLQILFGVLGMLIGQYMIWGLGNLSLGDEMPNSLKSRGGVGGVIGFLSVLMGIGGGSFGVPLMTLHGVSIHRAVSTAAGFGLAIALPSAIGFLLVDIGPEAKPWGTIGAVNIPAFLIVIAMTTLTAPIGASLAHRLDPKPLKRIFGGFLTLVALNMLWTALG